MKALTTALLSLWLALFSVPGHSQSSSFSRAELDQMLAPIALYPDTVLSHILIAATYPLEVVQADRWVRANPHLKGEDAVNAAELEDWDPSVTALVAFPDILRRMSEDLDWTQRLGDAFLADEGLVMDTIQALRDKAYASGNLRDTEYTKVVREEKIIVIEPVMERVVYIPYYDTRVVYGSWWWDAYPPVYWPRPAHFVRVGTIYWGPRTILTAGFFFSSPHWHQRRVVVIDYHHHHHPRYYSAPKIAHYHGAHHWQHNPKHRRNIAYRHEHVHNKYQPRVDSGRFSRDWRADNHRDNRRAETKGREPHRPDVDRHKRDQDGKSHQGRRDSGTTTFNQRHDQSKRERQPDAGAKQDTKSTARFENRRDGGDRERRGDDNRPRQSPRTDGKDQERRPPAEWRTGENRRDDVQRIHPQNTERTEQRREVKIERTEPRREVKAERTEQREVKTEHRENTWQNRDTGRRNETVRQETRPRERVETPPRRFETHRPQSQPRHDSTPRVEQPRIERRFDR